MISVDDDHVVRLINSSAEALLKTGGKSLVGRKLVDIAPELDRQLASAEREDVVQLASTGEPRTLAVKTARVRGGHVLTFDDITEQLLDTAPRRLVRRRAPDRARDQEPTDLRSSSPPSGCSAAMGPRSRTTRTRSSG